MTEDLVIGTYRLLDPSVCGIKTFWGTFFVEFSKTGTSALVIETNAHFKLPGTYLFELKDPWRSTLRIAL